MPDGFLYRILAAITDIRPKEARQVLGFFCHFFLITLSIYVIKPVKENLLIGITPAWWPYADFITAGLIGFVVAFNERYIRRIPRRTYFVRTTMFFAVSLLILWAVFEAKIHNNILSPSGLGLRLTEKIWPLPVFVFSFWADIFIVMSVTHFWFAVNDVFSINQGKRIVSFFVTGGLLGGIAGSLLTSLLVRVIGPVNLLLACLFLFLLNLGVIGELYPISGKQGISAELCEAKPGYLSILRTIRDDKYLRVLTGLLASTVVMASLINYQFKIVIKEAIPDDGARTSFLGGFFLAVLLLSAVFHLLTTGQVLKRFGIRSSLLLAPAALLLASLAVFLVPASGLVLWACIIRGGEKTLDCTIYQSAHELLYMPIPASIKYRAKFYIDMFINKLSVGSGAIVFWILYRAGSFAENSSAAQVRQLSILVVCLAVVCIILIWNIYKEYMSAVKRDLSRKWQDAHRILAEQVDLENARRVVDALLSRDKSSTLYAMSLFQLIRKEKLSPELIASLSFKEDELKADSMDSLLDVPGHSLHREIEETLADKKLVADVQKIVALDSYETIMERRLCQLVENENASEVERMEAAKLIGILKPTPAVRQCLHRLLEDSSPDVLIYAMDSAAVHHLRESIPPIIRLLSNPLTMPVAQDALASYGPGIEEVLGTHLRDPEEHADVQNAIPEVLARLETQKSADILSEFLLEGAAVAVQSVIDALYRLHSRQPGIYFQKERILISVFSCFAGIYDTYLAASEGPLSGSPAAPDPNWKARVDLGTKQVFDLLTLVYPAEDIIRAYQNILQGTRNAYESSLELLDNVLDRDVKLLLFPLIEDLPPEKKAQLMKKLRRYLDRYGR